MKISHNWLQRYIYLPESPEEIARLLTQSGLEVSGIDLLELVKGSLQGLRIGQIITCEKHPHADQLKQTYVDVGGDRHLAIICGAPNVRAGQKVVVAPAGATIYRYTGEVLQIKQERIRGVLSDGMLCAEDELGLGPSHKEVLVLDTPLPPGTPASQYFDVQPDTVLTIDLTPNRVDAASHLGIARELRAILDRPIQLPTVLSLQIEAPYLPIRIKIADTTACPRYTGIAIGNVKVHPSPSWLQNKLKAIGVNPVNNVVDITNFVMHELGQPLHAFDYDQLVGKEIHVQLSKQGTSFVTLDGLTRTLTGAELMISDQAGDIALAGVLGGKRARIHENTQNIFLESAYFSPNTIRQTTQQHGIKTEAAFRYERGTDPAMTLCALQRAVGLLQATGPGKVASAVIDSYPREIKARKIQVYYKNVIRLIGQPIPTADIRKILHNLDIAVCDEQADSFVALVPPYRVDVAREVDVIEEILRIYGYERIAVGDQLGSTFLAPPPQFMPHKLVHEVATLLAASGYHEIYTNSLTSSAYGQLTDAPEVAHNISILNPLSERLDMLRTTLLFSGLEVIAHNIHRKQRDLKLFEFGKTYHQDGDCYIEQHRLGIWITGNMTAPSWLSKPIAVTSQDLHAITYKILYRLGATDFTHEPITNAFYQAGIRLALQQVPLATAGKVSQQLLQAMSIHQPVFFAAIHWDELLTQPRPQLQYQAISKFPAAKRDLSLVLDQRITFEEIKKLVGNQNEPLIQDMLVFDVYQGAALPPDKKAYALSFVLQDPNKTLDDRRIRQVMERLRSLFEGQLGASVRE
ncbi:MAG: phenylalanine--tRNA ligase subunit beta [Bacteroidota bacterium]